MKFPLTCLTMLVLATSPGVAAEPAQLSFDRDIRPILSDKCFACHGPDEEHREAELRLDTQEGAHGTTESGARAIVPGDSEISEVWARIITTDEAEVMPPPESHKVLSAKEKESIRSWIESGAIYEKHWAFVTPQRPQVPVHVSKNPVAKHPVAKHPVAQHPIDAFVVERLKREGLELSPRASKETLLRRVTLDLTGLPPTLEELDAFIADELPDAYERQVERLLASPHYGERMAVDWLDAARYADTNGYQVDRDREMWAWRDWVIKAFNDNQGFDQFTIEQIAGDLLPNATLAQRIASGFNRNHMLNEEGAIIADEFLAELVADRVETTAAVWLAQTFNCCRCHDHKYDPFTQRDFYSLKAFFHGVSETGIGKDRTPIRSNAPPFVKLPKPEIEAKIAGLNSELKGVNDKLTAFVNNSLPGIDAWTRRLAATEEKWEAVELLSAELLSAVGGDQPPRIDSETRTLVVGSQESRENTIKVTASVPAGRFTGLRIEYATTAAAATFQWSAFKVSTPAGKNVKAKPLAVRAAVVGDSLASTEVAKLLDKNRKSRIVLSAKPEQPVQAVFELVTPLVTKAPSEIEFEIGVEVANEPSRWRVFVTNNDVDTFVPSNLAAIAKKESTTTTPAEKEQLTTFRLMQLPEHRKLSDQLNNLKKQIANAESEIPTTLVMDEMKEARPTFILLRGAYDKKGERVSAATPTVLPPLAEGEPRNRLGLAKWLVSPENPLPARVAVNRFWQQVFGTGLVKTSEDFGAQGSPPSHPELLDWLAIEFISSGWDVKQLMKLMVTSDTYCQQSQLTPLLRERDLENRLLGRGPRFRLMGEFVRDQALFSSGLLVGKIGGPSVKPYHPSGLYEQVASGSSGTTVYVPDKGDDLHRRSLYTYWKRSVPHPAMLAFGTPFRETCTLQRARSNTPLQALNLMNDETYTEASRFLAQRMIRDGGSSVGDQLIHGFRLVLSRTPKPEERRVLERAYERALSDFQQDDTAVKSLLSIGDKKTDPTQITPQLAAMTTVASTILCLDETVTKP